jgi:hypothetical protein
MRMGRQLWSAAALFAVIGTVAARSDDGPVVFEDRTKHISFAPPTGWLCDASSDEGALVFAGPKVYGVTSKLTIRNKVSGAKLEQVLHETLAEASGSTDAGAPITGEQIPLPSGSALSHASTCLRTGKGPALRLLVAVGRNGPFATTFVVETADKDFERARPELIKSLASVQWIALNAVYTDAVMGLTFFHLPKGFEVDPEKTAIGEKVAWSIKGPNGTEYGHITAERDDEEFANDAEFIAWAEKKARAFPAGVPVKSSKKSDFALSERAGLLYEIVLSYHDGKLLNTRWLMYVRGPRGPIAFMTSAEAKYFEELRPDLDRFLHSITVESDDASR